MPFDPFSWGTPNTGADNAFGFDPDTMRKLMGLQFISSAATNLGNMGLQRGQQPMPAANPMANMIPMMQMGMLADKQKKDREQAASYYGAQDTRAGGPGTWVNPDTGKPQYEGMISQAPEGIRPLLGSMDPDKGTATLASIVAQNMKPKELPTSAQEFNFYSNLTPDQQKQFDAFRKNGSSNLPAAPIQNDAHRTELVKQFGEDSSRVRQFDNYVRAMQTANLGGSIAILDPKNPGSPAASLAVTPKPEEDPDFKYKQAFSTTMGKVDAEMKGEAQKKAANAIRTLENLDGVESLIDKSTGSFAGASLDALSSLFGHATPGAIANGKLKVLQAGLMTSMPRMEGPQSDKDVALYREAAGQIGDPTVPNEIKKGAVETIRQLQEKYKASALAPKVNPPIGSNDGWSITPVK
jgi:hypothetical protein